MRPPSPMCRFGKKGSVAPAVAVTLLAERARIGATSLLLYRTTIRYCAHSFIPGP